ncbi:MAG: HlyC/CorC family transporter [Acidobacteria bacterium]|nr:HlyC/CorC family transporter [Acidobacteriota bacterium]MBI3425418.1 HlyC/CorC family transporter [Acidobacteriota bacterium]
MEAEIVLTGVLTLALVLFATAKSALDELSDVSLRLLASESNGTPHAAFWHEIIEHHHQLNFTLTSGIHFSIAAIAILLTSIAHQLWPTFFLAFAFAAMLVTLVIFRQVVPLLITQNHPERALLRLRWPLRVSWRTLGFFTWPVYRSLRALKRKRDEVQTAATESEDAESELQALIDVGEEEGIIEESEGAMIQSIIRFGDRTVVEVMTPRPSIVAIEARATLQEVRDLIVQSKYSRLPVYRDQLDDIFGVIYVRDLLSYWASGGSDNLKLKRAGEIARKNLYEVPETKPIDELLREMQKAKAQMAVVIDEFGGVAGLVTLEDLLEEIVGEIEDEDEPEPQAAEVEIINEEDGCYIVRGQVEVGKVERLFDAELAADDFTTIAGLVINQLGHLPAVGETLDFRGLDFEVLEADERRVSRLRIRRQTAGQEAAARAAEASTAAQKHDK